MLVKRCCTQDKSHSLTQNTNRICPFALADVVGCPEVPVLCLIFFLTLRLLFILLVVVETSPADFACPNTQFSAKTCSTLPSPSFHFACLPPLPFSIGNYYRKRPLLYFPLFSVWTGWVSAFCSPGCLFAHFASAKRTQKRQPLSLLLAIQLSTKWNLCVHCHHTHSCPTTSSFFAFFFYFLLQHFLMHTNCSVCLALCVLAANRIVASTTRTIFAWHDSEDDWMVFFQWPIIIALFMGNFLGDRQNLWSN